MPAPQRNCAGGIGDDRRQARGEGRSGKYEEFRASRERVDHPADDPGCEKQRKLCTGHGGSGSHGRLVGCGISRREILGEVLAVAA